LFDKSHEKSFLNSKHEASECSYVSKPTTEFMRTVKQRSRPPAIQISKKHVNIEPKSAFIGDPNSGLKRKESSHHLTIFKAKTEESQEISPLTSQNPKRIRIKVPRRGT
jgi:hypothetical protein